MDEPQAGYGELTSLTAVCNPQTLKPQFPGEQLAYIAALAVGAQLVFGDRPKAITYQRLHNLSSLADLDVAFGRISAQNYAEMLPPGPEGGLQRTSGHNDCVWAIMTEERDAVLAASLRRAADELGPCGAVAGIVGELQACVLRPSSVVNPGRWMHPNLNFSCDSSASDGVRLSASPYISSWTVRF